MLTKAAERAMEALTQRIYDRDRTDPEERDSTTDFAFEFIVWLRANGWDHIPPAVKPAPPAPPSGLHGPAIARQALAQIGRGDGDGR
ncbi:hypothetical protein HD597_006790 [Nonomuraea thailandensis]|uniref:Uncharacterized protein n=1 Tax=Nonomuraea thailandensis TaxID=1188745 RepID=A0A9X2K4V8_9ACTN|nr:hypothetical protein [Nonomuraea thailandensis]MCP2359770.1 hypothetical protein [Nonomuraea thailandensis]